MEHDPEVHLIIEQAFVFRFTKPVAAELSSSTSDIAAVRFEANLARQCSIKVWFDVKHIFYGIGLLYGILWLTFSGEMAEQTTKQIVAICCRCKHFFHLLSLSDTMQIVVYQIVYDKYQNFAKVDYDT